MSDDATKQQAITQNDIPANIEEIMHSAYLQYSLSVNVGRAILQASSGEDWQSAARKAAQDFARDLKVR